jgi:hypothetical protein
MPCSPTELLVSRRRRSLLLPDAAPTLEELERILARVIRRTTRMLLSRGLLEEPDPEDALAHLQAESLQAGLPWRLPPGRAHFLPALLPLVQLRASALGHRLADSGERPLRSHRRSRHRSSALTRLGEQALAALPAETDPGALARWRTQLEAVAREVDAGFSPEALPPALADVRAPVVKVLTAL